MIKAGDFAKYAATVPSPAPDPTVAQGMRRMFSRKAVGSAKAGGIIEGLTGLYQGVTGAPRSPWIAGSEILTATPSVVEGLVHGLDASLASPGAYFGETVAGAAGARAGGAAGSEVGSRAGHMLGSGGRSLAERFGLIAPPAPPPGLADKALSVIKKNPYLAAGALGLGAFGLGSAMS